MFYMLNTYTKIVHYKLVKIAHIALVYVHT